MLVELSRRREIGSSAGVEKVISIIEKINANAAA
jgi:hypothetical protein